MGTEAHVDVRVDPREVAANTPDGLRNLILARAVRAAPDGAEITGFAEIEPHVFRAGFRMRGRTGLPPAPRSGRWAGR